MIKKILLALGITSMTLTAAACNTVRGAGDDLESAANTVERMADLGCNQLSDDTLGQQLVIMGQVVYLVGQVEEAQRCAGCR